jgi:hypothetical protein
VGAAAVGHGDGRSGIVDEQLLPGLVGVCRIERFRFLA